MVKSHQKIKKGIFVPKTNNTFDYSNSSLKEKNGLVFLRLFTWNHPH